MKEEEVISFVEKFFNKRGFRVTKEACINGYRVDVLARRENEKYLIECRGDDYLRSHEIHVMIGQMVSEMHETGSHIHYCLAMPFSLATYLKDFGVEGIKALRLHLFIIGQGHLWKGEVFHLDTEGTITFIQTLKEKSVEESFFALFTLRKQEI